MTENKTFLNPAKKHKVVWTKIKAEIVQKESKKVHFSHKEKLPAKQMTQCRQQQTTIFNLSSDQEEEEAVTAQN